MTELVENVEVIWDIMSNNIIVIEFAWKSGGGDGPSRQIS